MLGLLGLAAVLVGLNVWLLSGALVPLVGPSDIDYLLLAPRLRVLAAVIGAAWLLLIVLRWLADRAGITGDGDPGRHATAVSILAPWLLLAIPVFAVALLATPWRRSAPSWLFFGIDLQWWLVGVTLTLVVSELGARCRPRWSSWLRTWRRPSRWQLEIALALILVAASLLVSPALRFQTILIGDEPKYVRYLENWYRGRGFDIEHLVPLSELPPREPSHLWRNVTLLGPALAQVESDLHQDLRHLRDPEIPAPPRSTRGKDTFVPGKRGGVYQIHGPGISALLLPGYLIDRAFLIHGGDSSDHFPRFLYGTQLTVLLLYAFWGVLVFRFLCRWTGRVALSWTLAAAAMVSQPVAAFAYQYYPEVLAGIAITLLAGWLVTLDGRRPDGGFRYGLLAGCLPWVHVRFGLVAVVAAVAVAVRARRNVKRLVPFGVGFLLPLAALAVYDYHVSGQPWPLYLLDNVRLFDSSDVVRGLLGFTFDRYWGLLGLAPVYLLALPGVWPAVRRRPATVALLAALVLGLVVPAAGHDWKGGVATPLRLVVSVVPLGMALVAESWLAVGGSRWMRVAFAVLAVLSIENGFTLNSHHARPVPSLTDQGVSGWKPAVLLPNFDGVGWSVDPLLWVWIVIAVAMVALPLCLDRRGLSRRSVPQPHPRWTMSIVVSVLLIGTAGSIVGALTQVRWLDRYAMPVNEARWRAATFVATHRHAFLWSSLRGRGTPARLIPNPREFDVRVDVAPGAIRFGESAGVSIEATGPKGQSVWGRVAVEFGDGTPVQKRPFFGRARVRHTYAHAGHYRVTTLLAPSGRPVVERDVTVSVSSGSHEGPEGSARTRQGVTAM